jgi:DNA invertase Pin-like site-specific DNA recombinase
LEILAVCRISTLQQDERSLEDQEAAYREWIACHADLPYDITVIASQGSGECLDRTEYLRAIDLVESGELDLVITEDLGRICRRVHAHIFCETCEDNRTRLIALNDHVDTGRDDWRLCSFFAVMRHETYNRDTSQRIRRSLRNRFSQGGVFQCPIYGYVKPEGARSDEDVYKAPEAEQVYDEWFRRLEEGDGFSEVADWLNDMGIRPGPYCRSAEWDGPMVGRVTRNPILKGTRVRNRQVSRRINRTGRRRSVNAPPEELLERHCPHLAFIEPERFDRVNRLLRLRNNRFCRHRENGRDPRAGIPKKRTRWPGQHIYCGVCERMYVYGGHGQKEHLMCSGAREYRCWNAVTVDGLSAAHKLAAAIFDCIATVPDFDQEFREMVIEETRRCDSDREHRRREIARQLERFDREISNVVQAIRDGGGSTILLQELRQLEEERDRLLAERAELFCAPAECMEMPSMDEIKRIARESFDGLAVTSPEFGRQMKRLIPRIVVDPFRLVDGGHIVLRAEFTVDLSTYVPGLNYRNGRPSPLRRGLFVDLFDPPQREEYRERVIDLRAEGLTEREVAGQLGITVTATQRAAALSRLMAERGLTEPYVRVTEPPEDYRKLRRHHHPRYSFEPLDNHRLR